LVIAKTILMWEKLCVAAAVSRRLSHGKHGLLYYFAALGLAIPLMVFIGLIPTIREEGFRFFALYTRRQVMRQLLDAYRR